MKRFDSGIVLLNFMAIASLLFFALTANAAGPANYPTQPVEYVTHVAPGGSMDVFGRLIQKILKDEKLLEQPLVVLNRQGSGGAVAFGYVFERKANPHVILGVASGSFLGTPLTQKLPYNFKSFTPICNFVADGSVLAVNSNSPFKTINDLIADARKRPKALNMGGSSITSSENMMSRAMQKAAGVQWDFISFASSGEFVLAALGGNIDFIFTNPINIAEQIKAGKLRPLLTGAPSRYPEYPDVPTIQEAGLGYPIAVYRGICGPPDMPDYAAKKLEPVFKKIFENAQFKKFMTENMMLPAWMSSAEYGKFLQEESDRTKGWLEDIKMLKQKK